MLWIIEVEQGVIYIDHNAMDRDGHKYFEMYLNTKYITWSKMYLNTKCITGRWIVFKYSNTLLSNVFKYISNTFQILSLFVINMKPISILLFIWCMDVQWMQILHSTKPSKHRKLQNGSTWYLHLGLFARMYHVWYDL